MKQKILSLNSSDYFIRPENTVTIETRDFQEDFVIHDHNFNELVIVFSGNGLHTWNGNDFPITCGDLFYINADDCHGYHSVNNLKLINVLYKPNAFLIKHAIEKYILLEHGLKFSRHWKLPPSSLSTLTPTIEKIAQECQKPDIPSIHLCEALFLQLAISIYRLRCQPEEGKISSLHQMDQLLTCLNLSINAPFSLEKFAQEKMCSARSLHRLFKAKTGMTVMEYLQQLRLCQAALLLRSTTLSISEIAGRCGYEDSNYFSAVFHKKMNMTASAYRRDFLQIKK
ncbi:MULTISPECIES: helix-turn-helix domain-containing protein [Providencia]|uniref:L-rhamnose operon transcriptional activator n=3 Tax=Providencia heimbachae TaxID=333962 RepID=A0A1B7K0F9_9GAMM|nr:MULTISPECIES: helix-turn-helix domain-containing protein [Providencia]MBP6120824.1 helix-turn-helix domain-containing protein [Providencia sp.]NIH23283.1 helix-turn-helix domain-containing protein [Providencia heimbachae]OAT53630.1 L-rhamnose operon transcriptional activator [Providencia heimbachae ATCC 35613]SQH13932.1 L-rhamnose operon transcriptional activator rhaR [Providencia heimbachae]